MGLQSQCSGCPARTKCIDANRQGRESDRLQAAEETKDAVFADAVIGGAKTGVGRWRAGEDETVVSPICRWGLLLEVVESQRGSVDAAFEVYV